MEQDNSPLEIDCDKHGHSVAAAICGHLVQNFGPPLGFIENNPDPEDLQGWCYACELMFMEEEDRTEKFQKFCQHSIVCVKCYEEIKAHHNV